MRTVLIETAYDGSGFHGWQIQPGVRTVQEELEQALSFICGEPIRVQGSSRTDAGVHAYGQAASFTGNFGIPAERIPVAVNRLLSDIRVGKAEEKPEGFHARYNAVGKTYLYRVSFTDIPDIFMRNYCYRLNKRLNTGNMEEAATYLIGTHDFNAFRSSGGQRLRTTVRTVCGLSVSETTGREGRAPIAAGGADPGRTEWTFRITGDGFLYNMVRIIVGVLVEVGLGRRKPEDMKDILDSGDRSRAGHTAPAGGLYLERVYFSEAEMDRSKGAPVGTRSDIGKTS
jgi:tRNA pseudouridine38-40 synthase